MRAAVIDQNNRPISGANFTWKSSDIKVVNVVPSGLATAVGNGTAQVLARYLQLTGTAAITVAQVLSWVRVEPPSVEFTTIGEFLQLTATVNDFRNNPIRHAEVAWRSSNPAVASVSANGLVTAVSPGEADITAMSDRVSRTVPVTVSDTGPVRSSDRAVLVALFNATGGPGWTYNTNWLSERPVGEWYGVTADENGRVTVLALPGNNMSGRLPSDLGGLTKLSALALWNNRLSGTIPPELGRLSELRNLSLQINRFIGNIPAELGNLPGLRVLELGYNELTGSIPPELGNLTQLTALLLNDARLTGTIPPELARLTMLRDLSLDTNQLSDGIPASLGNLVRLDRLQLQDNRLTGPLPLGAR